MDRKFGSRSATEQRHLAVNMTSEMSPKPRRPVVCLRSLTAKIKTTRSLDGIKKRNSVLFSWIIEIITSLDAAISRASRASQIIVILITSFIAYNATQDILAMLTVSNGHFSVVGILLSGIVGVCAGYLAISSLTHCINDSGRREQEKKRAIELSKHTPAPSHPPNKEMPTSETEKL